MEAFTVYLAVYLRLTSPPVEGQDSWLQLLAGLLMLAAVGCGIFALAAWLWRRFRKQTATPLLPWLRPATGTLFVIGVLAQTIALCFPASIGARMAQQQAAASGPWREKVFADGIIRISTPPNWEIAQNPNEPASSIYMRDRQNDSYLTAVLVPKQDLAVRSLKELCQQSAASLAASLTNPVSGEMLPGTLNGNPTIDVVQSGTLQGFNLVWRTRNIEYPNAWLEIRFWTTPSHYESQLTTFDQIAQSVVFEN
jgi:hypothetical protein